MKIIEGLFYSSEHEWVRVEGGKGYIGISDYAQHSLGDIVFVELPEAGSEIKADDVLGVVESVKAASDLYSPVSGTVSEVNEVLIDDPQKINENPYENWIAVVELSNPDEVNDLMDADKYKAYCDEGE